MEIRSQTKLMFINYPEPDLSVVIPCLNEEDTLGICLQKLLNVSCSNNFKLEVIVADNGSNDNSLQIANSHGANVINVRRKGYGSALQSGIEAAKALSLSWLMPMIVMILWKFLNSMLNFKKVLTWCKDADSPREEAKSKRCDAMVP